MKIFSDEPAVQQARAHSGRIVRALNDLAALVQVAWDKRYDKVLKYKSWQDYCLGEFGSGETAVRARQIVTVMLRGEDLTEQAIAELLGVSQPTVNRDLSEQADYAPARGGRTGDQRRQRRREQYRQPPPLTWSVPPEEWRPGAGPGVVGVQYESAALAAQPAIMLQPFAATVVQPAIGDQSAATDLQPAIVEQPAATTSQPARGLESTATPVQPAIEVQPAASDLQPAIHHEPAAIDDQPATQPESAATPVQPANPRERFLQGDTDGARAEIRRRVLAGQPVRRDQIARDYGVSEMFARQATAVEEAAAGIPDTIAHCVRELTALREKYARVLGANPWADQCLQLVIDSLRTD